MVNSDFPFEFISRQGSVEILYLSVFSRNGNEYDYKEVSDISESLKIYMKEEARKSNITDESACFAPTLNMQMKCDDVKIEKVEGKFVVVFASKVNNAKIERKA